MKGLTLPVDICNCIFFNENFHILFQIIYLKCVTEVPVNSKLALIQVMTWHRTGDKPLPQQRSQSSVTPYGINSLHWNIDKCFILHVVYVLFLTWLWIYNLVIESYMNFYKYTVLPLNQIVCTSLSHQYHLDTSKLLNTLLYMCISLHIFMIHICPMFMLSLHIIFGIIYSHVTAVSIKDLSTTHGLRWIP